jgi:hypothetical protein
VAHQQWGVAPRPWKTVARSRPALLYSLSSLRTLALFALLSRPPYPPRSFVPHPAPQRPVLRRTESTAATRALVISSPRYPCPSSNLVHRVSYFRESRVLGFRGEKVGEEEVRGTAVVWTWRWWKQRHLVATSAQPRPNAAATRSSVQFLHVGSVAQWGQYITYTRPGVYKRPIASFSWDSSGAGKEQPKEGAHWPRRAIGAPE